MISAAYSSAKYQELKVVPGWPVFLVVCPYGLGIYDDVPKMYQDTLGTEFHYYKVDNLRKCLDEMEGYFKKFYPNEKYNRPYPSQKNTLYFCSEEQKNNIGIDRRINKW